MEKQLPEMEPNSVVDKMRPLQMYENMKRAYMESQALILEFYKMMEEKGELYWLEKYKEHFDIKRERYGRTE